jgi:anti-sigma factor (TIGR02949 family)
MGISCEEAERAIPWFLDDELEAELALEMEAHLGACSSCRLALEREGRLRLTLRRATQAVTAPAALRRQVREAIERERRHDSKVWRYWPAAAAAAALIALAGLGSGGGAPGELEATAERHARDLPMDVVAGDIGKVQNYFEGKLPFVVHLPQLASMGVNSFGGRITHLADRDAAYVRYEVPAGRVSVFVYEDPGLDFSEVAPLYQFGHQRVLVRQVRGYNVAKWRSAGLTYSVVSDMPAQDFSSVLRAGLQ